MEDTLGSTMHGDLSWFLACKNSCTRQLENRNLAMKSHDAFDHRIESAAFAWAAFVLSPHIANYWSVQTKRGQPISKGLGRGV